MHDFALHANTAAMDDPDFSKAPLHSLIKILFNHDGDFPRLKRVQVDRVLDWDFVHLARI
jgi:hypothetical protein